MREREGEQDEHGAENGAGIPHELGMRRSGEQDADAAEGWRSDAGFDGNAERAAGKEVRSVMAPVGKALSCGLAMPPASEVYRGFRGVAILLIACMFLTGCASMRRHPALYGIATGVAVGVTIAIVQRKGHCPPPYNSGDPPCFPDPDGGKR